MESKVLSNGYSSTVCGWLVVNGQFHALAQVGPGFCILKDQTTFPFCPEKGVLAELMVDVDGDRQVTPIRLSNEPGPIQRILFTRLEQDNAEII